MRIDAEALRQLREAQPLTVRELATRSGVSYNTVTMLENRHRTAALGVEPRELMGRGGE